MKEYRLQLFLVLLSTILWLSTAASYPIPKLTLPNDLAGEWMMTWNGNEYRAYFNVDGQYSWASIWRRVDELPGGLFVTSDFLSWRRESYTLERDGSILLIDCGNPYRWLIRPTKCGGWSGECRRLPHKDDLNAPISFTVSLVRLKMNE